MKTPHVILFLIGLSLTALANFFNYRAVKPAHAYGYHATKADVKTDITEYLHGTTINTG